MVMDTKTENSFSRELTVALACSFALCGFAVLYNDVGLSLLHMKGQRHGVSIDVLVAAGRWLWVVPCLFLAYGLYLRGRRSSQDGLAAWLNAFNYIMLLILIFFWRLRELPVVGLDGWK